MINKISSEDITSRNIFSKAQQPKEVKQNPNFKGLGGLVLTGIQACERMPMVNVAVVDMLSAILPRTIVESLTNWFAGFEALRRESSGLIVNCLIPSGITYGIALALNPLIMQKGTNLANCWADRNLIDKVAEFYSHADAGTKEKKAEDVLKNIIANIEGVDGKNKFKFHQKLTNKEIYDYAEKLAKIAKEEENGDKVSKIAKEIIAKTHISENIKISGGKEVKASSVKSLLSDTVKLLREYGKAPEGTTMEQFSKAGKRLVLQKSLAGLAVVLPLAISMQYINRWITGKVSGVKGAPIYEDFGRVKDNIEEKPEAKKGLFQQKLISISSMIGVALLSMMKKPTLNMLEFKGIFPTMDQARIISTSTFCSRMAAADDKNELVESTIRDIATFCGLYFFGDYAAKATASLLQKTTGVQLLNEMKPLKENANWLQKFVHWVKDVNIKSSEEVIGKTKKEIEHAKRLRAGCQAANIGVSLLLLGLIIPIFTRRNTKMKHEQALKLAKERELENNQKQQDNEIPLKPAKKLEKKIA